MQQSELRKIAEAAKEIYESRLKFELEQLHRNEFVAIEPQSGEHFLGGTLSEALGAARKKFPDRLSHTMRVGHEAAVSIGIATP